MWAFARETDADVAGFEIADDNGEVGETFDLFGVSILNLKRTTLLADAYPEFIRTQGTKSSKDVRGIGHAEVVESVTLPDLQLTLGGQPVRHKPAHVRMKQNGSKQCVGNLGMDLLNQAPAFELDFRSMTLELQGGD